MTKPQKLSAPQIETLKEAARDSGVRCVDSYPPAKKLVTLGFAVYHQGHFGQGTLRATDAGRAALTAAGAPHER